MIGQNLGCIFVGLPMGTDPGIQVKWLSTYVNIIVDDISCLEDEDENYDYSQLIIDHLSLKNCRQLQPSLFLLAKIWDVLLNNASSDPLMTKELKPYAPSLFIF